MERLDKLLAGTGKFSRKEARAAALAGRVTVNGLRETDPGAKIPQGAAIALDGMLLSVETYTYLMLNKPQGLISSTEDPREPTVMTLLPPHLQKIGLFPVGRLDKDTEGLLLLTNDGPLAHHLLSPRHHVEKVYRVQVQGSLHEEDVRAVAQGIVLKDGTVCKAAKLAVLDPPDTALITLEEGKYHQVKRMMAALGKPVTALKRLSMGGLSLDETLAPGQWRPLTPQEREIFGGVPGEGRASAF